MPNIPKLIEAQTGLPAFIQIKLLISAIIIIVLWTLPRLLTSIAVKRVEDPKLIYTWQKASNYLSAILGVVVLGLFWSSGFRSFTTFLGLLSAGIALVLKDPLMNLAGWGFILGQKPFGVGDRIEINGQRGDVTDIGLFYFTLLELGEWVHADQSTGRIIEVPNGKVFTEIIKNYNCRGFRPIWNEVPVLVTFESDWEKAKKILSEIANKHSLKPDKKLQESIREASRKLMISYSKLTPKVYTQVEDSGVLLTMRYLCPVHQRRDSKEEIWEGILREFARHPDIDFAYPTRRVISGPQEDVPVTASGR